MEHLLDSSPTIFTKKKSKWREDDEQRWLSSIRDSTQSLEN